jgi:hypothetical protein
LLPCSDVHVLEVIRDAHSSSMIVIFQPFGVGQ